MDNIDSSDANAKVSDSAYSNSCSNSRSRRSRSSKSTHSGSNSSGSSGYGGKPTSNSSNDQNKTQAEKRPKDKGLKKKKSSQSETPLLETQPEEEAAPADTAAEPLQDGDKTVVALPQSVPAQTEYAVDEKMEIATSDSSGKQAVLSLLGSSSRSCVPVNPDGFWCVVSMQDGVVMYTTDSITTALGYPKDMWIGRSFIDFIHPKDHDTFASQITSDLATPKHVKGEERPPGEDLLSMFCRIRRYRGLIAGFGVKEKLVIFTPFFLKLSFKNWPTENGDVTYLVVQASPFLSYFKIPNELVNNADPFVLRHSATGVVEYVSPESVPFLGYLPQELMNKNAFQLYHPEDLPYLKTVYQTIVREGTAPRSNTYRMLSQNGYYVKLESEWSSFINPLSKKLEFVTGKHYTVEGPFNPDVFQTPESDKLPKWSEEEKKKAQALRQSIVTIINKMLSKPAEVAKQQMSKRCQVLATFMEAFMAEQTKSEDDTRLEIQELDQSCYERDSVILGGISPHHDYNDDGSSIETPLSYNQLNYNETLDRYFECYQERSVEDFQVDYSVSGPSGYTEPRLSYAMVTSGDSGEATSSGESGPALESSSPALRLTESLIIKHNSEMEKQLVKKHREPRYTCKSERERVMKESRQKKKEHLARCNAVFQPTCASVPVLEPEPAPSQPHGVKRISGHDSSPVQQKHHCSAARHHHAPTHTPHYSPYIAAPNVWGSPYPIHPYIPGGHGHLTQPMPMMGSMTPMSGMIPMYFLPSSSTVDLSHQPTSASHYQPHPQPVQYMMVPQPVFSSPIMYAPATTQGSFPVPQTLLQQSTLHVTDTRRTIAMTTSRSRVGESIEPVPTPTPAAAGEESGTERAEGSCHSSYYSSSFFKTEYGSAEESADNKKPSATPAPSGGYQPYQFKKDQRRKMEPPWMEKVCMTSELIYKYQLLSKSPDEVLLEDRRKILTLEQPSLVNEQLGQLYIDLQLEGVAARLTLEEGLTSSGSSGEETAHNPKIAMLKKGAQRTPRRKREYSKLAMIYEEDAPFPSSPENCKSS